MYCPIIGVGAGEWSSNYRRIWVVEKLFFNGNIIRCYC